MKVPLCEWTYVRYRRPAATVAAYVTARNRTCTAPGCCIPVTSCDLDHTRDWSRCGDAGPLVRPHGRRRWNPDRV
jgi:hypothetical protein